MNTNDDSSRIFSELLAIQKVGKPVALATVIKARGSVPRRAGAKMLVFPDGQTSGTIGGGEMEARVVQEAIASLLDGQPRVIPYSLVDPKKGDPGVCGGEVELYIEPFLSPTTVFVVGCGHVGRAVVTMAKWLGFRVAVTDDREELATPEVTPGADIYLSGSFEKIIHEFEVTSNTFVVVVTRNVLVDQQVLPRLLETPAPYIGVIGSKRRWLETIRLLKEDGLSEETIQRCHSPIGLEIHAETPEEIAVSILAEVIRHRRSSNYVKEDRATMSGKGALA